MNCGRCHTVVDELWASVEIFSRLGDFSAIELCEHCTRVVLAVTTMKETAMTRIWIMNDPQEIDDAEHPARCNCAECDPEFHIELRRDNAIERAS